MMNVELPHLRRCFSQKLVPKIRLYDRSRNERTLRSPILRQSHNEDTSYDIPLKSTIIFLKQTTG
jgi:hypothetical protein